jgi:histidinol-phosphate phosphatase family protein
MCSPLVGILGPPSNERRRLSGDSFLFNGEDFLMHELVPIPRHRKRAVFLDKDGTLVEDVPYNVDPARIRLTEGAGPALAELQAAGYLLVVISNQSGVAHGYFSEAALTAVERQLRSLLRADGVSLAGFYYCPHHPDGRVDGYAVNCSCRKPAPGLLVRAAAELNIDRSQSWMVGDILDDIEAGRRAGCRTVLVDNGNETEWRSGPDREPERVASGLPEAARLIRTAPPSSSSPAQPFLACAGCRHE